MAYLINRLPTRREALLIFALTFVILYSWATLMFFNNLPGWLLFLDVWSIAGMFAYSQVFALFESLLVLAILVAIAAVLPRRLFRERFVAQGIVAVILAAAAAITLHFLSIVPLWPSKKLLFGLLAYGLSLGFASWLIKRYPRLKEGIEKLADRLVILLYVYLPFVLLSVVIILARNIF